MNRVLAYLRRYRDSRKHVRPWAMAVPILVLLVCLPLLRPLRHPDPRSMSDDEVARLATVQAMVERHAQSLDFRTFKPERHLIRVGDEFYSDQPPVFSALLASGYWSMHRFGVTFDDSLAMVSYLLTVLGTTLPAAAIAGLVYRMGRLFELPRIWRTVLATVVVMGGGIVTYATVLNEHVPAAALVMASAACLVHIAIGRKRMSAAVWLVMAGFCATLAMTIDTVAGVFVPLLAGVVLTLPWRPHMRAGGLLLYALGCVPPILLHVALTVPVTGDWRPGILHPEMAFRVVPDSYVATGDDFDEDLTDSGYWAIFGRNVGRVGATLLGDHGLLSHFPALLLGMAGVAMVMHRHWPSSTKMLAASSAGAALVVVLIYALSHPRWSDAAFAVRWFVVLLPMLMFWTGAWLRKPHRPLGWAIAGILVTFSIAVSLIGATGPLPRNGFDGYTAADALDRLYRSDATTIHHRQLLAGRPD